MNKILVEVYLPVASRAYDVFIPFKSRMYEVLTLLSKVAAELSEGLFVASEDTIVCNRLDGSIYNLNMTVEELGFVNGTKIMLL